MKELKIKNSSLKIVSLVKDASGNFIIGETSKERLRYHLAVLINFKDGKLIWKIFGDSTSSIKSSPGFDNMYVITSETSSCDETVSYSDEEAKVICSFIISIMSVYKNRSVPEQLVRSLKDSEITKLFYNSIGLSEKEVFFNKLENIIKSDKPIEFNFSGIEEEPMRYQKKGYSIYSFMKDMVFDEASIYISNDYLEEYNKISKESVDTNVGVIYHIEDWCKVLGLVRNSTRTNLSFNTITKVDVNLPENEYKSSFTNLKTYKSYCIIRDGNVNMRTFAVKVSDNLARKLKKNKLIKSSLIKKGEFIVDLSPLPVVTKSDFINCSSDELAKLEVKKYKLSLIQEYINNKLTRETTELSARDKYFKNFGIDEKFSFYTPTNIDSKRTGSYVSNVLETKISGVPSKSRKDLVNEFITKGISKYDVINEVLLKFIQYHRNELSVESFRISTQLKDINNKINDIKFRLLMEGDARFNDPKSPFVEKTRSIQNIGDTELVVSWGFKKRTIYI